jgi:hypothetical protein
MRALNGYRSATADPAAEVAPARTLATAPKIFDQACPPASTLRRSASAALLACVFTLDDRHPPSVGFAGFPPLIIGRIYRSINAFMLSSCVRVVLPRSFCSSIFVPNVGVLRRFRPPRTQSTGDAGVSGDEFVDNHSRSLQRAARRGANSRRMVLPETREWAKLADGPAAPSIIRRLEHATEAHAGRQPNLRYAYPKG